MMIDQGRSSTVPSRGTSGEESVPEVRTAGEPHYPASAHLC